MDLATVAGSVVLHIVAEYASKGDLHPHWWRRALSLEALLDSDSPRFKEHDGRMLRAVAPQVSLPLSSLKET